jgi:Tol biopolymer transport system component
MPSLGGDARLLAHAGHDPRFSSDGRYIAFTTSKSGTDVVALTGRCYVIPADGGEPRLVSPGFRGATWPVWIGNRTLLFLGLASGNDTVKWWATDVETTQRAASTILPTSARGSASNHESNRLVFVSGAPDDVGGVWTVPFDPRTATATNAPSRVALGMGDGVRVTQSNTGTIAMARTDVSVNVWSLPLSGTGVPTQLTFDSAPKSLPDLSPDGRYLTFVTTRSGNRDVYLRDLTNGRETPITTSPLGETYPLFTSHGSHVAYAQLPGAAKPFRVFMYPVAGGLPELMTEGRDARFDQVSDDGRYVVWHGGNEPVIEVQDSKTKIRAVILSALPKSIFQPRISADGQWITFLVKADETDSHIYAARFRGTQPVPSSEWIPLTKGAGDDKPRLSADHRRLFFTSETDGYRCIWVQELDPTTLRPLGEPNAIHHFHSARRSLARVLTNLQEIAIGRDRLIFNMAETTGNVWLLRPETKSP